MRATTAASLSLTWRRIGVDSRSTPWRMAAAEAWRRSLCARKAVLSLYKGSANRAHHPAQVQSRGAAEEMAKQQQQQLCVVFLVAFLVVSAMNAVHVDAGRPVHLMLPPATH